LHSTSEIPNSSFSYKRCIEIAKQKSICVDKHLYKLIWNFILTDIKLLYIVVKMLNILNFEYAQVLLIVRLKVLNYLKRTRYLHMYLCFWTYLILTPRVHQEKPKFSYVSGHILDKVKYMISNTEKFASK
jgi:hypothetical protein